MALTAQDVHDIALAIATANQSPTPTEFAVDVSAEWIKATNAVAVPTSPATAPVAP